MPIYTYRGMNKTGKEIKATLTSDNLLLAKQKIKASGILLLDIQEGKTGTEGGTKSSFSFKGRIKSQDLALMTRQFSTLIKARIQVVQALTALTEQIENHNLKIIISEIRNKVNEGSSLAQALADHPKIFDNVYVNMVEAGEASGNLDVVLLRLADFTEARVRLLNKLKSAMTYPVVMLFFSSVMIMVIFTTVIPKIAAILLNMKKTLPLQTRICIYLSQVMVNYWWMIIGGVIVFAYLIRQYLKTTAGERRFHALQLKFPVLGNLIKMVNISRFCSTLATLLNSGVPILTAMNIVKNLIPNVHMREAVEKAKISVSEGKTLTTPLIQSGYFPPMVTHMIRLGEQSGELEPMLEIVSKTYEEQVNTQLSSLTSLLEPIMLVVMGGIVGFVVFSVIVPMMQITSPT